MLITAILSSLVCFTTYVNAGPIANDGLVPHGAAQKRNILVPGYLIPTTTIDVALVSGTPATSSPDLVPTSQVTLAKRTLISIPDLVPTVHVDLATDTLGTQTISPLLVPTKIADIGATTAGCVVSISDYSYVTHCSYTITPTPTSTGVADCCGGQDSLHPCNDAGTIPTGPATWICTFGSTTCAGVSTATTMWT
ncbi:hypothetical protein LTR35_000633 [Friedmanniomyces endolithicus]|uniref:Uncharacterized protein n=1 Tax=Friedmanniomyces endolithicus TaxID=329885 RepID=A0AAN6F810_9PEZI|nr:hypothetical protein LTS00_012152 [Friedmanniomyces endolithicus]KAK0292602.1 hypothetical protein LTR35_000633 [Friedmanniomyces endolithicus]KAK0303831.1 hypothetical protein LTR82_017438 [Friedmanniomyces endolithicus]KAK1007659.1 hypothetical protein LTR54_006385 [Friedmanniomyces endolithicus]